MRTYDRESPLIVIHIPKAAGTSSKVFFRAWYGDRLLCHYFNKHSGKAPEKHDLFGLHSARNPVALHGHFNKLRGFGIQDYYPEVKQFVAILRDPYELEISRYFYGRKQGVDWAGRPVDDIGDHLAVARSAMLNHFPRNVTYANYKGIIEEYFVEVGIAERFGDSMKWMASKLGFRFEHELLGHHNATERDQFIPANARELFIENNQLEFDVYRYVLDKFTQQGAPPIDNSVPSNCFQ